MNTFDGMSVYCFYDESAFSSNKTIPLGIGNKPLLGILLFRSWRTGTELIYFTLNYSIMLVLRMPEPPGSFNSFNPL